MGDFLEGRKKSISVKDLPATPVTFLLELMYSGTTNVDFDHTLALAALDLAHRWQVGSVMQMIERAMEKMLSDDNFATIAEAAQLKSSKTLIAACATYASRSPKIQSDLKKRKLPWAVLELLGAPSTVESQAKK